MQLEIIALRHQLAVYQQSVKRPTLRPLIDSFGLWLSRLVAGLATGPGVCSAPHRHRLAEKTLSRLLATVESEWQAGPSAISREVRELIQDMWRSNPTWGSPRIVGELRKLGINVAKSTVEKYRPRIRKPPSPTWKAFLNNHVKDIVACDFFTVPTATFRVLFVFIMLAHERRRIVHFNITEHPTAQWTAQQIVEAFPWDTAPRYLLRDRDAIYGERSNNASRTWASKR